MDGIYKGVLIKTGGYYSLTTHINHRALDVHYIIRVIECLDREHGMLIKCYIEAQDVEINLDRYSGFYKMERDIDIRGSELYHINVMQIDTLSEFDDTSVPLLVNWYKLSDDFKDKFFSNN